MGANPSCAKPPAVTAARGRFVLAILRPRSVVVHWSGAHPIRPRSKLRHGVEPHARSDTNGAQLRRDLLVEEVAMNPDRSRSLLRSQRNRRHYGSVLKRRKPAMSAGLRLRTTCGASSARVVCAQVVSSPSAPPSIIDSVRTPSRAQASSTSAIRSIRAAATRSASVPIRPAGRVAHPRFSARST
jgi:hypothetical protein